MVEIPTVTDTAPTRQGLDRDTWQQVLTVARARLTTSARARGSTAAAARDLALIQVLGGAGLRSGEARALALDPFDRGRSDNQGGSVYLRVHGKGNKVRAVPLYTDVATALDAWRETREQLPELAGDERLFCQLGRCRRDGSFPDAGGELSTTAVIKIVRPILLAAGVPPTQAHPHTLRHTFGRLYMAAPGAELSRLQRIMGMPPPRRPAATSTTPTASLPPSTAESSGCTETRSPGARNAGAHAPAAAPTDVREPGDE